jgi:cyclase
MNTMTNALDNFLQWPTGMHAVADGIYAYVQGNGPYGNAGFSNAGLVVGPDYCVVIDTLGTSSMHDGFVDAIRRVTDKPVGLVLLTHHHVDHVLGVRRFMPVRIACHRQCRAHVAAAKDTMAERWRNMRPLLAHDIPEGPAIVPDLTFQDRISVHLGERELVFFHPGVAHTDGDAAVWIPDAGVLFAGDLFFNRVCPAAFQGDVDGWIAAVDSMLGLGAQVVVPGHGPVADPVALEEMKRYLLLIREGARSAWARGIDAEAAARTLDVGEFRRWSDTEERLLQDVQRVYAQLEREQAGAAA